MVTPTHQEVAINSLSIHEPKSNKHLPKKAHIQEIKPIFGSFLLYLCLTICVLLIVGVSFASGSNISLGTLYDCSLVYHSTLYKFTDHAHRQHKMHLSELKVKYFHADVLQYLPRSSYLTIYHCTAERLVMTCHESFFGHKSKHRSLHTIPVTVRDCDKAMKLHTTCYGTLRKHSHAEWRTHTPDSYSCKWMTTRRHTYNHFKIIAYPARLVGNDKYIQQHLSHTHCSR